MELRDYFNLLIKYWKKILLTGVIFGFFAYVVSFYLPTYFQASVTVYVQRVPEKPAAGDYTYDGFYAQKAAESYTDTVFGFLQSGDVLQRAAEIAKLPTDSYSLASFAKKTKLEKVAPQLIDVRVSLKDKDSAKSLALSLAQSTQERISLLNQEGDTSLSVDLVNPEPLLKTIKPWKELNTAVGFLGGLLLAIVRVFLKEYLTRDSDSDSESD